MHYPCVCISNYTKSGGQCVPCGAHSSREEPDDRPCDCFPPEKRLPLLREASTSVRDHSLSAPGTALFAYVIRKD